jgi:sulfonate transport system substrate-binding protein
MNAPFARRLNRRALLAAGVGAAALGAAGRLPNVARAAGEVRIGYQKGTLDLLVLKGNGDLDAALKPSGVSVTWTEFNSGPPLLEALNAGGIDFGSTGAPPAIFAQAAGTDLVYVLANKPSPHTEAIIVPPDSPIKTLQDLKGKQVAVTKGSSANALLVRALQKAGLQWGDAEPVYLQPADAKAAFEGGSVDAWSIWDPYYAAEQAATGAKTLADDEAVGANQRGFYLASRTFATERAADVKTIVDALTKVNAWAADHPDDVVKIQAEVTGLDPAILKTVVARSVYGVEPITPQVIADQQALADVFFNIGLIPEKIDIAKAVVSPAAPATT